MTDPATLSTRLTSYRRLLLETRDREAGMAPLTDKYAGVKIEEVPRDALEQFQAQIDGRSHLREEGRQLYKDLLPDSRDLALPPRASVALHHAWEVLRAFLEEGDRVWTWGPPYPKVDRLLVAIDDARAAIPATPKGQPGRRGHSLEARQYALDLQQQHPQWTVKQIRSECLKKFPPGDLPRDPNPSDPANFRRWLNRPRKNRAK
jgi:hypothetical protein